MKSTQRLPAKSFSEYSRPSSAASRKSGIFSMEASLGSILAAAGPNQQLEAPAALDGIRGDLGGDDVERLRQQPLQLLPVDAERRTRRHLFQRIEEPDELAARLEDRRQDPDVVGAARRVDGAVTGVLPRGVEAGGEFAAEVEDVALEHPVSEASRLGDGARREVEAGRIVAASGEQSDVVAAAATGDCDGTPRWGRLPEQADERR